MSSEHDEFGTNLSMKNSELLGHDRIPNSQLKKQNRKHRLMITYTENETTPYVNVENLERQNHGSSQTPNRITIRENKKIHGYSLG